MEYRSFGEDPRTRDQQLAELLESFRRAERELRRIDNDIDGVCSDEACEIIRSVREGLAQVLMRVVMAFSSSEQGNA